MRSGAFKGEQKKVVEQTRFNIEFMGSSFTIDEKLVYRDGRSRKNGRVEICKFADIVEHHHIGGTSIVANCETARI